MYDLGLQVPSGQDTKEVSAYRADFIAKFDGQVVRLEDELERMIKLVSMQRTALENQLFGGLAYKQQAADASGIRMLKDLTAAYNSLTDSKVRLEKTAKDRASKMTPDEEKEAVITYLKALPAGERTSLIQRVVIWHNAQKHGWEKRTRDLTADLENLDEPTSP